MKFYFDIDEEFDTSRFDYHRRLCYYKVKYILTSESHYLDKIEHIKRELAKIDKPMVFRMDNKENVIVSLEKGHNNTCSYLEENGFANPSELSVYDFRSKIAYIEEKIRVMKAKSKEIH